MYNDRDMNERVAALEVRLDTIASNQQKILERVTEIDQTLYKFRGWIGAIVFIITAVGIFLREVVHYVKEFWS